MNFTKRERDYLNMMVASELSNANAFDENELDATGRERIERDRLFLSRLKVKLEMWDGAAGEYNTRVRGPYRN